MSNSRRQTALHFIMFRENNEHEYTGICYELSLVLSHENPEKLKQKLENAAFDYVKMIYANELDEALLNQSKKLPAHYRELFEDFAKDYNVSHAEQNTGSWVDNVRDVRAFMQPAYA